MAKDYKDVAQSMAESARRENAEREARRSVGIPFPTPEGYVPEPVEDE